MNEIIENALTALEKGHVIGFPTDTVYGIACLANNMQAIEKIYDIKGRDKSKALIAMVPQYFDIEKIVTIPDGYRDEILTLIGNYWPGELTLIFNMKKNPYIVLDYDTIGLRIPNHEVALEVLNAIGTPLFVTSANYSGEASCVTETEVRQNLGDKLAVILSGECKSGVASTIISYANGVRTVLRKGKLELSD